MRLESMHRAAFAFVIVALLFAVSSVFPVHVRGQGETPNPPNIIRRGTAQVQIDANRNVNLIPGPDGTIQIFASTITPPVSPPGKARLYLDTIAGVIRISINGGAYVNLTNPGSGFGTVQSVGLSLPNIFTVINSPITSQGTFGVTFKTQAANTFLRGATGSGATTPFFGALVPADIPVLDASIIGSGTLGTNRGGLGNPGPYTFGDFLYYGTTGFVRLPGNITTTRKFLASTGDGVFTQTPTFFQLASGDIPAVNLAGGNVSGGVFGLTPTGNGGTGLATLGAANNLLGVNATGSGYEFKTPIQGNNITITHTAGGIRFDVNSVIATSTLAPDGSAAAPSISFQNEQSSGHYRFGAGDVRVSVLGSDVARFFSGGLGLGAGGLKFGNVIGSPDVTLTRASAGGLRIDGTAAANGTLTLATLTGNVSGTASGNELPLSFTAPLARTVNAVSIPQASSTVNGFLSSTDFSTFNGKQNALGFTPENSANKGVANGYPALNGSGVVPTTQLPALNYLPLTGGTLTGDTEINTGANPTLLLSQGAQTTKATIQNATGSSAQFSSNAQFTGSWNRFNTAFPAWNFYEEVQGDTFAVRHATAGANPISWTTYFNLTSTGSAAFVGNVSAPAFASSVATGTAPFIIASTTVVPNLNAALLNGQTATTASTANTIVAREANSSIRAKHYVGDQIAPTITVSAAGAGTGATVSIDGSDTAGLITIVTGAGATSGSLIATVTLNSAFTLGGNVSAVPMIQVANPEAAALTSRPYVNVNTALSSTSVFYIYSANSALVSNTTYKFTYHVLGK